jgi:hypothetical protein
VAAPRRPRRVGGEIPAARVHELQRDLPALTVRRVAV